jgi:hypothetical protein
VRTRAAVTVLALCLGVLSVPLPSTADLGNSPTHTSYRGAAFVSTRPLSCTDDGPALVCTVESSSTDPSAGPAYSSTRSIDGQTLPVVCPTLGFCYSPVDEIDCNFDFNTPIARTTGQYDLAISFAWGFKLSPTSQAALMSPYAMWTHYLYEDKSLFPLTWDSGTLHEVYYQYHGALSAGRFTRNDVLRWEGQAASQSNNTSVVGRFKCILA